MLIKSSLSPQVNDGYLAPKEVWTQRLCALPGMEKDSQFEKTEWKYVGSRSNRTLSWNYLESLSSPGTFLGQQFGNEVVAFAKKLWISMVERVETRANRIQKVACRKYDDCFNFVLITLHFCEDIKKAEIGEKDLDELVEYFLMNGVAIGVNERPLNRRKSPLSYTTYKARMKGTDWVLIINGGSSEWPQLGFTRRLNKNAELNALRSFIEKSSGGSITWADYKQGGSLDMLGLDNGQWFVAHCMLLVETYSDAAKVISQLYASIPHWIQEWSLSSSSHKIVHQNLTAVLMGEGRLQGLSKTKFSALKSYVRSALNAANINFADEDWSARELFQKVKLNLHDSASAPVQFIALIRAAATVSFVALAGWRESEYGFSLSDIKLERNDDPLTQKNTTKRVFVDWYVPKTSGDIRQKREITQDQHGYAVLAAQLNDASESQPCFLGDEGKTNRHRISTAISQQLLHPWSDFVENGSMPAELKTTLSAQYPYWLVGYKTTAISSAAYKGQYCRRRSEEERVLLDSLLDKETVELIKQGNKKAAVRLRGKIGTALAEMSLLKPNCHSFRHMWAEAILRRYDGDVGWMIRSQFKHMGERFWLAYTRDKSTRGIVEITEQEVTSGLLRKVLMDRGNKYVGPTAKMIHRVFKHTDIIAMDSEMLLGNFVKENIVQYKASPFGYCILRRQAINRAQCAEDGVPQRQNASEKVCLGCTNFLTSTDQQEEILFIANLHSEVVLNPIIPGGFKYESARVVKNASKWLAQLGVVLPESVERAVAELAESEGVVSC
jgi:hypothetical protein